MMYSRTYLAPYALSLLIASAILAGCATFEPSAGRSAARRVEDYMPRPMTHAGVDEPRPTVPDAPSATEGLTVNACVEIALANNPWQAAAKAGLLAASEAVGEARAPYYPHVSLEGGYRRWEQRAFLPDDLTQGTASIGGVLGGSPADSPSIGPTDDWRVGVGAQFTLFDSGERRAQHQAALARRDMAAEERNRVMQDVAYDVERAYYALASAVENREAAAAALERAEDHLRITEIRRAAGAAPQADVVRAQSEVAEARLRLIEGDSAIRVAQGNLNTVMGLPAETPLEQELAPEPITSPDNIAIEEEMDNAVRARPEVAAALKEVEAGEYGVAAARSSFGPRVTAQASYGWRDETFAPGHNDWSVGLGFEWPLFTGFARKHAVARNQAEVQQAEAELRQGALAVRNEVWAAFAELNRAYEAVEVSEAFVQEANEGLRLVRARYEAGATTISDLLDAQAALVRAEAGQVASEWDYFQARAAFNRATGAPILG